MNNYVLEWLTWPTGEEILYSLFIYTPYMFDLLHSLTIYLNKTAFYETLRFVTQESSIIP